MSSSVYKIIVDDDNLSIEDIFKNHELDLAIHTINVICDAIEKDKAYVQIARIVTPSHFINLKSEQSYYIQTLEINRDLLIPYEEYEMCAQANKAIEKMKNKLNIKYLEDKKTYVEKKKKKDDLV